MDYKNCPNAVYHTMTTKATPYEHVTALSSTTQVEVCTSCNKVFSYHYLPNGEMADSRQYFLDHIRYFAQPIEEDPAMMAVFLHCNPGAAKRFEDAAIADKKHEFFQKEMDEKFRWAIKKALNNEGWVDKGDLDGRNRSSRER